MAVLSKNISNVSRIKRAELGFGIFLAQPVYRYSVLENGSFGFDISVLF